MDDPTLAPPPRPPLSAAAAAWLAGLAVYSATMALWTAQLTVFKENTRLDLEPASVFYFIIHYYFAILGAGVYPGIGVSFGALFLGWRRQLHPAWAFGIPAFLGVLWVWVGWLLISDNIGNVVLRGEPFHWPH